MISCDFFEHSYCYFILPASSLCLSPSSYLEPLPFPRCLHQITCTLRFPSRLPPPGNDPFLLSWFCKLLLNMYSHQKIENWEPWMRKNTWHLSFWVWATCLDLNMTFFWFYPFTYKVRGFISLYSVKVGVSVYVPQLPHLPASWSTLRLFPFPSL